MPAQLTLNMRLRDEASLDNFLVSAANAASVEALTNPRLAHRVVCLWGADNTGRTHLAQALCQQQELAEQGVLYLPLRDRAQLQPEMLQGTAGLAMVCLDDMDAACGDRNWEMAVFHLYNRLQETDTRLLVTANCPPQHLAITLADLRSRLQSGLVLQLLPLGDEDKCRLLSLRAANRGMSLGLQVAEYIVKRADRSLDQLMTLLDKLDRETLQRRRTLTIPLVRDVMGW